MDPTFWIIARTTGLMAYLLLAVAMVMGVTLAGRGRVRGLRPADVNDLHRRVTLTALVLVAVHGVALVLDNAVDIPVAGLLVPGLVPYRTLWVGVGVAAAWVMGAVYASFWMRSLIGPRVWRRLHYAAYGVFALATAHGLAAGTDSDAPWVVALYAVCVGAVAGATVWRAGVEGRAARRSRGNVTGTARVERASEPTA